MSSIAILKQLWRRRLLVVAAVIVAAAVSLLFVYQVTLSPPSATKRSHLEAEGSIQVLVDSANSPIADARRDLSGLTARAGVFARLMAGGNVVHQIAASTGIPFAKIDVAGPLPLPGEAPGISEAPARVNPYRIEVSQQAELPILTVITRAPTVAEARALAAAAPRAISREVTAIQAHQQTPPGKRVEFRTLGPAQAAVVDDTTSKKVAAGVFVVLTLLFLTLIVGLPRFVAAWRRADGEDEAAELAPAGRDDGGEQPPLPSPALAAAPPAEDEAAKPPRGKTKQFRRKGAKPKPARKHGSKKPARAKVGTKSRPGAAPEPQPTPRPQPEQPLRPEPAQPHGPLERPPLTAVGAAAENGDGDPDSGAKAGEASGRE